jgi:hypothetical protein
MVKAKADSGDIATESGIAVGADANSRADRMKRIRKQKVGESTDVHLICSSALSPLP